MGRDHPPIALAARHGDRHHKWPVEGGEGDVENAPRGIALARLRRNDAHRIEDLVDIQAIGCSSALDLGGELAEPAEGLRQIEAGHFAPAGRIEQTKFDA